MPRELGGTRGTAGDQILPEPLLAARRADAVIVPSAAARRAVARAYVIPEARIHVVHHGVSSRFRPVPPDERSRILARHALCPPYVLFVGARPPRKNLERLVTAVAHLRSSHRAGPRLAIAGPAEPGDERIRALVRRLGIEEAVRWLGWVHDEELSALYGGALCLAYPSLGGRFHTAAPPARIAGSQALGYAGRGTPRMKLHIEGGGMQTTHAPGPILRDEMLEAQGRTAFPLDRGQTVRVVDVDGQQVADFVCFRRPDTSEKLSVHNTALIQGTVHISTGHLLLSDRCGTLMTITADTCGRHDLLAGSCSEGTNRWRYGVADTPNCRSNFEAALRPFGIPLKEVPYSFNIFMNVPIGDGKIGIEEPLSRAGDLVDLRAETDLLVAISNCPQERNPCNAYTPTRLRVVVFGPPPA